MPPDAQARRAEIRRLRSWAKQVGGIPNERLGNALGSLLHRLQSWAQRIEKMRNRKARCALSPFLRHLLRWVERVGGIQNDEARRALEALLLRLERLEAAESAGLLEAPPLWQRWRRAALGILAALGVGLVALLGVLATGAGKRLEEALKPFWESPPLVVVILAVLLLAILVALLTRMVERWKK